MAQLTPLQARDRFKERLFLTFGLRRKPLRSFCEHCGKFIPSDMEWTCGYCDTDNYKTNRFSFLYKCQHCKEPPRCVQCPHCDEILFLNKKQYDDHPAKKIAASKIPENDDEKRAQILQQRDERKAELEHKIVVTRLNAELVMLKKSIKPKKAKSTLENLEESFSEHEAHVMAVHTIHKRAKDRNAKEFANDPTYHKLADDAAADWAAKMTN